MRRVRGLSPILSTMILLSAALIAGIILYTYFTGTMKSMVNTPNIAVDQATYYPSIQLLDVQVKNYGGAAVNVNGAKLNILVAGSTCTCNITCGNKVMLKPFQTLDIRVYLNGLNGTETVSGETNLGCSVSCSISQQCQTGLLNGEAYVSFEYSFAGSTQATQPTPVSLG